MIAHLGVVIPARDEEELIGRCLAGVLAARAAVGVRVTVVVVADGCRDRTVEIARTAGVEVLEVDASNVGVARAEGVEHVLAAGADWIACTDADSVVPSNWLTEQLRLSETADLVLGTVRPDPAELGSAQAAAWERSRADADRDRVYGASLGIRASAYRQVGGFRALAEHEDVDLVGRLRAAGARSVVTAAAEVVTSGRLVGRTPGGFARFLRDDLHAAFGTADLGAG